MYFRINSPMEFENVSATYSNGKLKVDVPTGSCNIAFCETTQKEPKSECWYGSSATYETQNPEAVTITLYGPDLVPYIFKYGGKRRTHTEALSSEPEIEMNCTNEAGQIISVSLDGNNVPTTLIITNLTTQAQTVTGVEANCSHKEVSVNASGVYSVSLLNKDSIIKTQKIIVNR